MSRHIRLNFAEGSKSNVPWNRRRAEYLFSALICVLSSKVTVAQRGRANGSSKTFLCILLKSETLITLTVSTLNKCSEILRIRKVNNLSSKDTILPKEVSDFQLYHAKCYKAFTALPPKYRKPEKKSEEVEPSTSTETNYVYAVHKNNEVNRQIIYIDPIKYVNQILHMN